MATLVAVGPAAAAECPGNPNAIGTSRTIVVDPSEHTLLGGVQYRETLPLEDREVVLTFDDGPLPPYSTRILDILAHECVKVTYFMVGRMVRNFPKVVRRAYEEGHTIANHSQNHSYAIHRQPIVDAWKEIDDGFESLRVALGDPKAVAPFFRFPGLLREDNVERFLAARKIMSWSVDVISDDSSRIHSREIIRRAISRLEAKGKGIVLLHDIQPATANALPELLRELKARGFRIVHVVPAGPGRVTTPTTPEQWAVLRPPRHDEGIWHNAIASRAIRAEPVLDVPDLHNFGADEITGSIAQGAPPAQRVALAHADGTTLPVMTLWPDEVSDASEAAEALPAPALENFRYVRLGMQRSAKRKAAPGKRKAERVATSSHTKDAPKPKVQRTVVRDKSKDGAKSKDSKGGGKNNPRATGHQFQIAPRPQASLTGNPRP